MIKTHGLSHVALSVLDPDRSLAFYQSVFGVREYFRSDFTIRRAETQSRVALFP
jgi:catechol 2,3-dioxygenase-like lactoylglutathione lyase family enzyme